MFYRHDDFSETLVHQCENVEIYTTQHKREIANVRKHDITAYLNIPSKEKEGKTYTTIHIKYCPFCGVNLDEDKDSGETLSLKLL